jgi:hypothetical protein
LRSQIGQASSLMSGFASLMVLALFSILFAVTRVPDLNLHEVSVDFGIRKCLPAEDD